MGLPQKSPVNDSSPDDGNEIFIGRQPIYDASLNVVAYELLYRSSLNNSATIVDGEQATLEVLNYAFMDIGFDDLVGNGKAFVNMPRGFLVGEYALSLPKERVVLELLEDVEVDDEVVEALKNLSREGFTLALDDFEYREELDPLVDLAEIIKIDLMALSSEELRDHASTLKKRNRRLLAEKVETKEEFEECKALGFELFQGYYFSRPQVIKGEKMPGNRLAILQLIGKVHDPEVSFSELENLISQDVALSLMLLKVINSAAYGMSRKVESMKRALAILGLVNIRNWTSMIVFSGIDDKPSELFTVSMIRAKMCELIACELGQKNTDTCFTVGLFSNLDALMDRSLVDSIKPLPLSADVKLALLEHSGCLGHVLKCVLAYEKGQWSEACVSQLSAVQIRAAYVEALHWSSEVGKELVKL